MMRYSFKPVTYSLKLFQRHLFAPVDIACLVYFRVVFGAVMFWEVCRYFNRDWIGSYWITPKFNFNYAGFEWVSPLPGLLMYWHFALLGVLAILIAVGWFYRVSMLLFSLGFIYIFLLEPARYLNHFYLICLISGLMIFLPAHRAFSIDSLQSPRLRSHVAPAWTLWLLRFQIAVPYFFGGIAKLNGDWLRGQPMGLWLSESMDFPLIGSFFDRAWMVYLLSYSGLLLDLFIVPFLLWKRTRWAAFGIATIFHLTNARLFSIGIFPWFMIAATALFFEPDWPRRFLKWVFRGKSTASADLTRYVEFGQRGLSDRQKGIAAAIAIYMVVQCVLPLRHYLYPGNVNWTEEGHRFAWHMKLRDKDAKAEFFVRDPSSGWVERVEPEVFLTSWQARKMAARPDMVLQFCHYLATQFPTVDGQPVEVRARVMASLNGRSPQLLIDPSVDLVQAELSYLPSSWIIPLTTPLSPLKKEVMAKVTTVLD